PLAPLQEGILFHHLLQSEGDAYLLRSVAAFDSRDRLDKFLAALQAVIDRHHILRTSLDWTGLRQAVAVGWRGAPLLVEEIDLGAEGDAVEALMWRSDPRRVRLDLRRAPLIAAYIAADRDSGEWLLGLLNHHVVSDHITLELIFAEIEALLQGRGD